MVKKVPATHESEYQLCRYTCMSNKEGYLVARLKEKPIMHGENSEKVLVQNQKRKTKLTKNDMQR